MECQVGIEIDIFVLQRHHRRFAGVQRRGMAHRAADVSEQLPAPDDGVRVGRWHRRCEEAHEDGKLHDIAGHFERIRDVEVGPTLRRRLKIASRCLIPLLREELVRYSLLEL